MDLRANLQFNLNQALKMVLHLLSSDPSSPTEGQVYHNTTTHHPMYHNGSAFADLTDALKLGGQNSAYHLARANHTGTQSADSLTDGTTNKAFLATERTKLSGIATGATANDTDANLKARANHTGTQTASTISDFDTQVRTNRLDQMAAPTGSVSMGSQKITNQADGTAAADSATLGQVQSLIATGANKTSVRAATTVAGTLATSFENGDAIDGVTLATGDRILIKNQAAGAENGLYTVNASGAPTRATDADISAEVKGGLSVWVNEGTANADTRWALTTNDPITLGSTALTFVQDFAASATSAGAGLVANSGALDVVGNAGRIVVNANDVDLASGVATPSTYKSVTVDTYGRVTSGTNPTTLAGYGITDAAKKYTALIGDNSATSFNITQATHGCASDRSNLVQVVDEGTGVVVIPDITIGGTGTVTIAFAVAPTTNQYRVIIHG